MLKLSLCKVVIKDILIERSFNLNYLFLPIFAHGFLTIYSKI